MGRAATNWPEELVPTRDADMGIVPPLSCAADVAVVALVAVVAVVAVVALVAVVAVVAVVALVATVAVAASVAVAALPDVFAALLGISPDKRVGSCECGSVPVTCEIGQLPSAVRSPITAGRVTPIDDR